jgi:hypothetical protein
VDVVGTDDALGRWVPENITSIPDMAQEEAPAGDELVLMVHVFRDMGIGKASKGAEVANIRFAAIESLKRRAAIEHRGQEYVLDVC